MPLFLRSTALVSVPCLLALAASAQGPACPAWEVVSDQAQARMGSALATAGDVNGDGYADVIVSAVQYTNDQPHEGRAYVYLGSAGGLSATPAWTAELDQAAAFGGSVSSAGDVNGDGFDDVIVGAAYYDDGELNEGAAFVYLGLGLRPLDDSVVDGRERSGVQRLRRLGRERGRRERRRLRRRARGRGQLRSRPDERGASLPVPGVGRGPRHDPGLDGRERSGGGPSRSCRVGRRREWRRLRDVLVAATEFDTASTTNGGRAYLYLGSAAGSPRRRPGRRTATTSARRSGWSLAALDANGDGFGDVLVGSVYYGYVGFDVFAIARTDLFLGSATGLASSPAWTVEHDEGDARSTRSSAWTSRRAT
jgi:hypothetical protein